MEKVLKEKETISLRMENDLIEEVKEISKGYAISMSEFIRQAVEEKVIKTKQDFFFRLSQVEYCSKEESDEIIENIKNMSNEDLKPAKTKKILL